jgi:4'-phosphopantetheinyl transferase
MVKVLISTVSEIAKTTDLASASNKLNIHFLNDQGYLFQDKMFVSTLGRLMLQRLFDDATIDASVLKTLHRGAYGKWQLSAPVDFNVSHADDKIVAVFSDEGVVGVDIEKVRDFEWQGYKESFSSAEWTTIYTAVYPEQIFFDLWTKKESILKAYGYGLQIPLAQVSIENSFGQIESSSMTGYFNEVIIPGYKCYVCTQQQTDLQLDTFIF